MLPVIRAMNTHDVESVRELMCQLTQHEMSVADMQSRLDFVNASSIDWLFVYEMGQIWGVLGFRLRERLGHPNRYGEISLIVTAAELRRQGVGRALMDFAEQFAREHDCIGMWLVSSFKREDEAHYFYTRLGYETTGYRFVKLFED